MDTTTMAGSEGARPPAASAAGGGPHAPIGASGPSASAHFDAFRARAAAIRVRHDAQTAENVAALREKYERPVFGRIRVWQAIEMLAQCIDPTDTALWGASQQLHVLQILDAMENEGAANEDFVLAALLHDLGKLLLLAGEAPENVVCLNRPIGEQAPGIGLDRTLIQWNHDEFAWSRLGGRLPDGVAWLIRYHSIRVSDCAPYMDRRDRDYTARYLLPFARYDHGTKSPFNLPRRRLSDYRPLVDRHFPEPIVL